MKKNKKRLSILALLVILLVMSIGFAALSSNLNINGTSIINNAKWDVHFENVTPTAGSVTATTAPALDANRLNITYAVTLTKPGDYYEFTVDVKNAGSVDAKLSALPTLGGLSNAQDVYTNYTFTHSDGTPIQAGEILAANTAKNFKVRVEFDSAISASQLPTTAQTMTLTVSMNYEQA